MLKHMSPLADAAHRHDADAAHRAIQTSLLVGTGDSKRWAIRVANRLPEFTKFLAQAGYHLATSKE